MLTFAVLKLYKMEKEFIPYEQALALKELGFDEPCFWLYDNQQLIKQITPSTNSEFKYIDVVQAPLYQQAFRWFREKFNLQSYIRYECPDVEPYYDFVINEDGYDVMKDTHEEAELECLKKLIEIVKEK